MQLDVNNAYLKGGPNQRFADILSYFPTACLYTVILRTSVTQKKIPTSQDSYAVQHAKNRAYLQRGQ